MGFDKIHDSLVLAIEALRGMGRNGKAERYEVNSISLAATGEVSKWHNTSIRLNKRLFNHNERSLRRLDCSCSVAGPRMLKRAFDDPIESCSTKRQKHGKGPTNSAGPLPRYQYAVGWISALPLEQAAAERILDRHHENLLHGPDIYTLGEMCGHGVVLTCLPRMGTNAAAVTVSRMQLAFPSIEFILMVGIGGGVPGAADIRLGDVVVSVPTQGYGGVVQYDFGKTTPGEFKQTGHLNAPSEMLLNTINKLRILHLQGHIALPDFIPEFNETVAALGPDILFQATYNHTGGPSCANCNPDMVLTRKQRPNNTPVVHYGTIASGNQVIKDGAVRDEVSSRFGGVLAFEMEAAGLMNSASCLVIRGICDYADSHKNKSWQPYAAATAAAYAKELLSITPKIETPEAPAWKDIERMGKVNRLLHTLDKHTCRYEDRKNRNIKHIQGTCQWFISHPRFQEWIDSSSSNLLWVSADPGCGKSVLVRYLVDDVIRTTPERVVCYFFFKDDFEDQRTAKNAICAILRQLFIQKPSLVRNDILARLEDEAFSESFHEFWSMFLDAVGDSDVEIVCIIDALDECQETDRCQLIGEIRELYSTGSNTSQLKFLLTSRPYGSIRREFRELERRLPSIHLSGEDEVEVEKISHEIDLVIESRVQKIGDELDLEPAEILFLQEQLTMTPNRTYLWIHLTLDVIRNIPGFTKGNVRRTIRQIPQSVDEAYTKILNRSANPEKARILLHAVTAAKRPLKLSELAVILALEEFHSSWSEVEDELEPERRFRITVRDICGLFVVVVDHKVYLLHQTAKEFLVQRPGSSLKSGLTNDPNVQSTEWKHSLCPIKSNRILAERCIWFIILSRKMIPPGNFIEYAGPNWAEHFREAAVQSSDALTAMALGLCKDKSIDRSYWLTRLMEVHECDFLDLTDSDCIIIASYYGLHQVVTLLLEEGEVDVEAKDTGGRGRTALSWAATEGHEEVVRLLVEVGKVDVESRDRDVRTALSWAAGEGHVEIVRLLVEKGKANLESQDWGDRTPLAHAVARDQERVVRWLVQRGDVNIENKDINGRTPLMSATQKGHLNLVKILLELGKADVEARESDFGRTPLIEAVINGDTEVVKMLLELGGADVEARDEKNGLTPLAWATREGQVDILDILLKTSGVKVESRDRYGRTPLLLAATYGFETTTRLLLVLGKADVEAKDNDGMTPLITAARNGHWAVVRILLEEGKADITVFDYFKDRRVGKPDTDALLVSNNRGSVE